MTATPRDIANDRIFTAEDAASRIAWLVREVDRHNRLYHEQDAPEISDAAYDLLFLELTRLEGSYPELALPDSPTRKVGGKPLAELLPFPHEVPMPSLANAFGHDDLVAFDARLK
jgi:DNA ligase (NAD+)